MSIFLVLREIHSDHTSDVSILVNKALATLCARKKLKQTLSIDILCMGKNSKFYTKRLLHA